MTDWREVEDGPPHATGPARWWAPIAARPHVPSMEEVVAEEGPPADGAPWAWPDPAPAAAPVVPSTTSTSPWTRRTIATALAAVAIGGGIVGSLLTRALDGDDQAAAGRSSRDVPGVTNGSGSGSGGSGSGSGSRSGTRPTAPPLPNQPNVFNGFGNSVADVVAAVEPAVVSIQVEGAQGVGAGTGVILTAEGEVLTNAHVVEGATTVRVLVAGEAQPRTATIVGDDPSADLALLRLEGEGGLPTVTFGASSGVAVGDDVVAIGNALGLQGGPTVTRGIVSALGRTLETARGTLEGLIQTDASISSGNSGGPLVNVQGQVIGINTAVAATNRTTSAENIGFAIAVDRIAPVVERLRRAGSGASPDPAPAPGASARLGVEAVDSTTGRQGATVQSVTPLSAAALAGVEEGDLIVRIGDKDVVDATSLAGAVRSYAPGDKVDVVVVRDGRRLTLPATLDGAD
jgi:putative serine protease PepD